MAPKIARTKEARSTFDPAFFRDHNTETRFVYMSDSRVPWQYERHINFKSFGRLNLEDKFLRVGLRPLLNLEFPTDKDLAKYFWANLTCSDHDDIREATFTSYIAGQVFSFNLHQLCRELGVSQSGLDPMFNDHDMFLLKAIEFLTDAPLRTYHGLQPPSTRLFHYQVFVKIAASAYILRHNLFPHGSQIIDEIPHASIITLWCMFQKVSPGPINVEAVLFHLFREFTTQPMHFIPFPRLVGYILSSLDIFTLGTSVHDSRDVFFSLSYVHRRMTCRGSTRTVTVPDDGDEPPLDPFGYPAFEQGGSSLTPALQHTVGGQSFTYSSSDIENYVREQALWRNSFTEEVYDRFDQVKEQNEQQIKELRNLNMRMEALWNVCTTPKKYDDDGNNDGAGSSGVGAWDEW